MAKKGSAQQVLSHALRIEIIRKQRETARNARTQASVASVVFWSGREFFHWDGANSAKTMINTLNEEKDIVAPEDLTPEEIAARDMKYWKGQLKYHQRGAQNVGAIVNRNAPAARRGRKNGGNSVLSHS